MGDEGGSFMMAFVFSLLFYFLFAWVVSRIGNKFGVGTFGEWCIPIYNMVLMFRCAGMSGWNLLWFLVPIANIIVTCVVWAWPLAKINPFMLAGIDPLVAQRMTGWEKGENRLPEPAQAGWLGRKW